MLCGIGVSPDLYYLPLREKVEWGYIIPYMITGMLNEHPRTATASRDSPERNDFVKFYDILTTPEPEGTISREC